ncbi:MAG: DNA repair protein RecN [Acidimicrobiales bacterium]
MLLELTVRNLGVIDELGLVFQPGMTALTGETGAGKTLVVEAIELLVGGRADASLVRPGADEAWVEGRFVDADGAEVILGRAIPVSGRSRGYIDGRMAAVGALAEAGGRLVDLHGQHAHQSLLSPAVQRRALDAFGRVDHTDLDAARARLKEVEAGLAALGGDARERARELDLVRFQLAEVDAAQLADPDEEAALEREEAVLAEAGAWREAAANALAALHGEGGAVDAIGSAVAFARGRSGESPFHDVADRLAGVLAELSDAAVDLRDVADAISEDPSRLDRVQERRQVLRGLRRKYGDTLADVIAFAADARARLRDLESYEERATALEADRATTVKAVALAAAEVHAARRIAAPKLAKAVEAHLIELAMANAAFGVEVEGDAPGDVVYTLSANLGEPLLPLAKVASGGELARTMLAARLVLTAGPPTLVFDEVDAGIGGEAAIAVGRALAGVARQPDRQVLVVTHLPQVAAFADVQVAVVKREEGGRTIAGARAVEGEDRLEELSRMLSGQPRSASARSHAAELLATAAAAAPRASSRRA